MADLRETAAEPRWYMAAAIAAVAWEAFGCAMYLMQVTADPAGLPLDQRAMWDATPGWMVAAYAIAVWIGLAGAIMLVLRRKLAEPLLLASFAAILAQFSGLLLVPALRDRTPADAWLLPLIIIAVGYSLWHFARKARASGWLR
ncbi:hypothetical protein [Sphingomonas sp.]|uniref:hypothetical protein n=1 Tax=Sphingomonas sp. TaxID=28214 RepID=UPI00286EADE1|nr:hypothetical protein [Sphingomonas sp.]